MSCNTNGITTKGLILQGIVTAAGLAVAQALLGLFDLNISLRERLGKIFIAFLVIATVIVVSSTVLKDSSDRGINVVIPRQVKNRPFHVMRS